MAKRTAFLILAFSAFFFIFFSFGFSQGLRWPMEPRDSSQPLGNNYGEYQYYGGAPYLHPGIDIMGYDGQQVYAIKAGIVKAVLTTQASLHWRVAVGDSSGTEPCDGWLYAHLDLPTIQVSVGDTVEEGEYLGDLVYWPTSGFHHLHFVKIWNIGMPWQSDWKFIANPLDEIYPIDDPDPPVFQKAFGQNLLAFCTNNTDSYFGTGLPVSGDVDIIAKIYDITNHPSWRLIPYQIEFSITGNSISYGPHLSFIFTDTLFWDKNVDVIYQDDGVCNTRGDYYFRDFYFNLTNSDGDSVVESSDIDSCWHTEDFPNGAYWVKVDALDRYGNLTQDSMQVTVLNTYSVSGRVGLSDAPPDSSGSVVSFLEAGMSDTTDSSGFYFVGNLEKENHNVKVSHSGYATKDTVVFVTGDLVGLDFILDPLPYIEGDANGDHVVDFLDILYLIDFIFSGGSPPAPYLAGDANCDLVVEFTDILYLIDYVFSGGPPPGC